MLWNKLLGTSGMKPPPKFVGGRAFSNASSQTPSCSITGLSGGLATAPAAGDIVIACIAFRYNSNADIQCTTSGYTEVADLYSNDSNDANLGVYYKVLSSAETSVAFNIGHPEPSYFAVHVWRGVDQINPLDAINTAIAGNTGIANAPQITTETNNSIVMAIGAAAYGTSGAFSPTVPDGMENFFGASSSTIASIGIASILRPSAGDYNPPAFGAGSSNIAYSMCAATIALRPA